MKFYLLVAVVFLLGCQQTTEQLVAKNSHDKAIKSKVICQQSTTPPLKNTDKLKEMLIAKGKIDASLPDDDINRAVKAYIDKKNAAYKNCKQ